jgi:hypothetical protein
MVAAVITCPKCLGTIPPPPSAWSGHADSGCPRCGARLTLAAFPRLAGGGSGPSTGIAGQTAQEGDAVCKFYPELQAETVCEECGCLMSRKASVEWGRRIICMPCLHLLRETKGSEAFSSKRTLHENVAVGLVVFLAPLSLITGPIALFYLLRHRRAPRGLVPRGPFRWWLALALSLAVTLGWIFLFIAWIALIVRAATSS